MWPFTSPKKPIRCGQPEWDGQQFALDDTRIPAQIRQTIAESFPSATSIFFTDTKEGGEWLLFEGEELLEILWVE